MVYFDDRVTVICLANVESGLFNRWEKELLPIVFEDREPKVYVPARMAAIEPERITACVGDYRSDAGFTFHVVQRQGHLFGTFDDWPVRSYLMPTGDDELFMRSEFATIRLTRKKDGQVDEMTIRWGGQGEPTKLTRHSSDAPGQARRLPVKRRMPPPKKD